MLDGNAVVAGCSYCVRCNRRPAELALVRLSRRFCSRFAMYSRTSASDCGPTEMVRLRVFDSIAGISDACGRTLSSLRRGGTLL